MPYLNPPVEQPQARLVASLAADGSDVKYLAVYDAAHHEVGLSHVSGERAAGKDFELWMIEGKNAPVSMGVIPAGATAHIVVSPAAAAEARPGRGARRQPRAGGRFADRPADRTGGRRGRSEEHLTGLRAERIKIEHLKSIFARVCPLDSMLAGKSLRTEISSADK